jgi:hypothetical protein
LEISFKVILIAEFVSTHLDQRKGDWLAMLFIPFYEGCDTIGKIPSQTCRNSWLNSLPILIRFQLWGLKMSIIVYYSSFNENCHERIEEFILSETVAKICQNEKNNGNYIQYSMLFEVG